MTAFRVLALVAIAGVTATACAPTTRFHWGNYEDALYGYAKSPDLRETYRQSLETTIERGLADNRLAPGLMAELGYLHLEEGDAQTAVSYFEQEMQHFPESAPLMTRVIEGLSEGRPTANEPSAAGAIS